MTQGYKEYIRVQREKRIEATLPAPMGEEATAALGPIKQETTDLANRLGLVQAGLAMASAGKTRAAVSQVADKALNEYGVLVMPSVAGQIFSEFGVRGGLASTASDAWFSRPSSSSRYTTICLPTSRGCSLRSKRLPRGSRAWPRE